MGTRVGRNRSNRLAMMDGKQRGKFEGFNSCGVEEGGMGNSLVN